MSKSLKPFLVGSDSKLEPTKKQILEVMWSGTVDYLESVWNSGTAPVDTVLGKSVDTASKEGQKLLSQNGTWYSDRMHKLTKHFHFPFTRFGQDYESVESKDPALVFCLCRGYREKAYFLRELMEQEMIILFDMRSNIKGPRSSYLQSKKKTLSQNVQVETHQLRCPCFATSYQNFSVLPL